MKWTSSYDGAGNVTNIHDVTAASTTVNFDYAYDVASELTQEIDNGSATTLYSYDATGELVSAGSTSYNYDSNGNPTNTGDVVGVNNELLSDGTYNYTYDNVGNEITKTDIATSDTWTYTYNNGNQLTSAVETNSSSQIENEVDYEYDVFGNKIEATTVEYGTAGYAPSATTSTTKYAIDQWNPGNNSGVASVWADLNASNGLQTRYIGTNNVNQLVARIDVAGTVGTAYWYLEDRQNSTRDIITNSAALVDTINYDAYGNIIWETSPTYGGDYKYTGEQFDSVTGLQYNDHRWYDPLTGRWMSQDPMGFSAGDSNLYRYVNNSPMDGVDPSGEIDANEFFDGVISAANSRGIPVGMVEELKALRSTTVSTGNWPTYTRDNPVRLGMVDAGLGGGGGPIVQPTVKVDTKGGTIRLPSERIERLTSGKAQNEDVQRAYNEVSNAFFHQVIESRPQGKWMLNLARKQAGIYTEIIRDEILANNKQLRKIYDAKGTLGAFAPTKWVTAPVIGLEMTDEAMSELADSLTINFARKQWLGINTLRAAAEPLHNDPSDTWGAKEYKRAAETPMSDEMIYLTIWMIQYGSKMPAGNISNALEANYEKVTGTVGQKAAEREAARQKEEKELLDRFPDIFDPDFPDEVPP